MLATRSRSRTIARKRRPTRVGRRRRGVGLTADDPIRLVQRVRAGFGFKQLLRFQKTTALPLEEIARLVRIAPRTLSRRQREGRLHSDESERLLRVSTIFDKAVNLFDGDVEAARRWLQQPQRGLDGETPFEFATTEIGARQVEDLITRLEHGVFT